MTNQNQTRENTRGKASALKAAARVASARSALALSLAMPTAACTGSIDGGAVTASGGPGGSDGQAGQGIGASGGAAGTAGSGAGGSAGASAGGQGGVTPEPGPGEAVAVATPLIRLTRPEYAATVAAAFEIPEGQIDQSRLPQDELVAGFTGHVATLINDVELGQYLDTSGLLAEAIVNAPNGGVAACTGLAGGKPEKLSCLKTYLEQRLPVLHRRPVDAATVDELMDLAGVPELADQFFKVAATAILQRALMSPRFLFKLEWPQDKAADSPQPLDDHGFAARLSFFLTGAPQDAELRQAAAEGKLSDPAIVKQQVERLLATDGARERFRSFHQNWLHLPEIRNREKSATDYPEWTPALREGLLDETALLFDETFRTGAEPWRAFFTARHTYADKNVAALYGATGGNKADRISLEQQPERAGFLTHASFLATHSHDEETQAIHRGNIVRQQVVCQPLPPPVDIDITQEVDRLVAPNCAGCHKLIEAIGTGFDNFDGIGRKTDAKASGVLTSVDDQDRPFETVGELAGMLAQSDEVADCIARQWLRFALGFEGGGRGRNLSLREYNVSQAAESLKKGVSADLIESIARSQSFRLLVRSEASVIEL